MTVRMTIDEYLSKTGNIKMLNTVRDAIDRVIEVDVDHVYRVIDIELKDNKLLAKIGKMTPVVHEYTSSNYERRGEILQYTDTYESIQHTELFFIEPRADLILIRNFDGNNEIDIDLSYSGKKIPSAHIARYYDDEITVNIISSHKINEILKELGAHIIPNEKASIFKVIKEQKKKEEEEERERMWADHYAE